ncbi:MAG TPA: maleylpyruvate isomerase family mycothiol-dependent enzyme [Acidimicrobiales bacterium]|nr:maleylpyruvate isomerase family mycothiol-dependent enzyme [Acidimicrobiales bacterium]
MQPPEYVDALRDRSEAMIASVRGRLDAPVPSCPKWTVADLVAHMGQVWGWAAAIVRTGSRGDLPTAPEGGDEELVGWAEQQARSVVDALEGADPGSDCWTFGLPRSRLFWFRRQALETAVHTWDARNAAGISEPIAGELASDGIDEFASVMLPRRLEQHPGGWTGQTLHLHRTDGEGEWMFRLGPDGALSAERAHGKGDVALRAPASSLYLWCLNRVPSAELEVFGDSQVAERWTAEIAF